ncbi:hypothetical protein cyc_03141 [Cyclospora cayetanensis]|uniref:Transmembrane protein n=1 Tax=Cyclospora cayetanensis TaxID=88456 RepID=A0A1D3CTH0_9EIME|nr:hypothetical protein cyc_03141 [Cyclospora cayetanensis]
MANLLVRFAARGVFSVSLFFVFLLPCISSSPWSSGTLASSNAAPGTTTVVEPQNGQLVQPFHMYGDIKSVNEVDLKASTKWLKQHSHLSLLKLALPATYMSTLTDVNTSKYAGKVEAQDQGVLNQLEDGVRILDVRLWRGTSTEKQTNRQTSAWFTEVPWRLSDDMEVLRSVVNASSTGGLPAAAEAALEVHGRTELADGLFKPVRQFLRESLSEVVVVVFSAVNGNVHTNRNSIASGSELGESLTHADKQLQTFLKSGLPYSDETDTKIAANAARASQAVRMPTNSAYRSPLLDSFVKKDVSFFDFAEIAYLVDTYWGQLLPRHTSSFVNASLQTRNMRDSAKDAEGFRQWQRKKGEALMKKSIADLRDANIRLLLLVDDPLLAWFITTRSRSQVVAFVKADHLYDVSFKSEAQFAPCATPHVSLSGHPTMSRSIGWPSCRSWCEGVGQSKCFAWTWRLDQTPQFVRTANSRREGELGSIWDEQSVEVIGQCQLFTAGRRQLSFEAITQAVKCSDTNLIESDLPWTPKAVMKDLLESVAPLVPVEISSTQRRRSMRRLANVRFGLDSTVCMLTTGSNSGHEMKYNISNKLIRVLVAPPTPEVRIEAMPKRAHGSPGEVVQQFNATLAEFLQALRSRYKVLQIHRVNIRPVNAFQVAKYDKIQSALEPFAAATFYDHIAILNRQETANSRLLDLPVSLLCLFYESANYPVASPAVGLSRLFVFVTLHVSAAAAAREF